jgi:hypothetical protein
MELGLYQKYKMINLHRSIDQIQEWLRYPQPNRQQQKLLGMYTDVIDTDFTAIRLASEESTRYILENMRAVSNFKVDYDLHKWVATTQLDQRLLSTGQILEFGVATGRTLNQFAYWLPHKTVHGFDGFQGLPEDWTSRMKKGFFARDNLPRVRKNCELHVGWFDQTLPGFVKNHPEPIALLHIDCDLYSSTVTILNELKSQIVPGTVIIFDEYINYPGWQLDEFKAWQEHVSMYNISYKYIGYVSRHQKVAIQIC